MSEFASVYALLYGSYHVLHKRLLDSLSLYVPSSVRVVVWCNQVCPETRALLEVSHFNAIFCEENKPKYLAMREMFTSVTYSPLGSEWVVWFDDDSYVERSDWYVATKEYVASRRHQNICYFGQPWFVHHLPGQWEFISRMPWFRNKPPELIKGRPGITFAQGAYWGLRTDVLRSLDWPPSQFGLSHNGGDTLLGEAIRQADLPFHKFHYGVKINAARRRGHSEPPAGSNDPRARR